MDENLLIKYIKPPRTEETPAKLTSIRARVTAAEKEYIHVMAKRYGRSVTGFILFCLAMYIKDNPKPPLPGVK